MKRKVPAKSLSPTVMVASCGSPSSPTARVREREVDGPGPVERHVVLQRDGEGLGRSDPARKLRTWRDGRVVHDGDGGPGAGSRRVHGADGDLRRRLARAGAQDGDRGAPVALAGRVCRRVEPEADRLVQDARRRRAGAELRAARRGLELDLDRPGAVSARPVDERDRDRLARARCRSSPSRSGGRSKSVPWSARAGRGDLPRRADPDRRAAGPGHGEHRVPRGLEDAEAGRAELDRAADVVVADGDGRQSRGSRRSRGRAAPPGRARA